MPNHVTNVISAPKEVLDKLVGEETVDFNKVIPMPVCINSEAIPSHIKSVANLALGLLDLKSQEGLDNAMAVAGAIKQIEQHQMAAKFNDEEFELFISYMRSYRECGHTDWYSWSIENWGTKWNAYDSKRLSDTEVVFQTAWSAPHQVIIKLAYMTGAKIHHEWADEDTGNNVGYCDYDGGVCIDEAELSGTNEGYELAFKLNGGEEDFELVNGEYIWNVE